jgi:formiminotetrahydrofolate cyclodeaminase
LNVRINLATMDDGEFKKQLLAEGQAILRTAHERADAVGQVVDQAIGV